MTFRRDHKFISADIECAHLKDTCKLCVTDSILMHNRNRCLSSVNINARHEIDKITYQLYAINSDVDGIFDRYCHLMLYIL